MNPRLGIWSPFNFHHWPNGPAELKAGVDEYSHKRAKSRNSNATEPLCKECRVRKVRGKCRTAKCAKRGS